MIENLQNEIWKDVPEYEGKYQVSNMGRVKTFHKNPEGEIMSPGSGTYGYMFVYLSLKGKIKRASVHRLVALLFVPNPYMYKEINHIDGNKANNKACNLEWCTRSQNMLHAFATGLKENKKGSESNAAKSFYQFDKSGNLIREWGSLVECAEYLSRLDPENGPAEDIRKRLSSTLHDRHKSCCGFLFGFEKTINAESKKKDMGQIPVVATLIISGRRGHYVLSNKEEDTIRFSYVNETEGYVMPNGQKACATLVSKCCKGKRDSHVGYKWKYESEDEFTYKGRYDERVLQYDKNWNLIKPWDIGVSAIAQELGAKNNSGLSKCLNSADKDNALWLGYHWVYEEK